MNATIADMTSDDFGDRHRKTRTSLHLNDFTHIDKAAAQIKDGEGYTMEEVREHLAEKRVGLAPKEPSVKVIAVSPIARGDFAEIWAFFSPPAGCRQEKETSSIGWPFVQWYAHDFAAPTMSTRESWSARPCTT